MRENRIRTIWDQGGAVVNGWLAIANTFSAEVVANQGFDSVTVDMQHGMVDFQPAVSMLAAISTREPTPLARVPWNDPAAIMKILDAGAYGVVCPMINTREECERFVGACRYAPDGYRSFGPSRAVLYAGNDYASEANASIITFAMIETREAVDNVEDILSVEGLDAIYIGPNDLALSLGYPPSAVVKDPDVVEAVANVLAAAKRHGVRAGIHTPSGKVARDLINQGFDFVTIANDVRLLVSGTQIELAAVRNQ